MSSPEPLAGDPGVLAERIAERIREHPAVAGLHGGPFGSICSYLPGRRVVGVRVDVDHAAVQVAVVLRPSAPLPQLVAELRSWVTAVTGPVRIDVTVADIIAALIHADPASAPVPAGGSAT
jgi:hypothetical protein